MPTPNIKDNPRGTLTLLRALVPGRVVSPREALQIAELQAVRLRRHLGIDQPLFPSDALNLPRIRVQHDADLPSSGMTFWNGSTWMILLNSTEAVTRQRFSMLHEFKHVIDHTTKHRLYGATTQRHDPVAERTADYFAACVLMPKMYVKRHWGRGPRTLTSMAETFGVSPAAMKYRLDQLGLANEPRRCQWSQKAYRRALHQTTELAA